MQYKLGQHGATEFLLAACFCTTGLVLTFVPSVLFGFTSNALFAWLLYAPAIWFVVAGTLKLRKKPHAATSSARSARNP
jgi:hypothetical protein